MNAPSQPCRAVITIQLTTQHGQCFHSLLHARLETFMLQVVRQSNSVTDKIDRHFRARTVQKNIHGLWSSDVSFTQVVVRADLGPFVSLKFLFGFVNTRF